MVAKKPGRRDNANLRGRIVRLWRLVELLHESPRGLSPAQIERHLGASRATCYRDLDVLKAAGVAIQNDTVNGEARYRVERHDIAALSPTPLQLLALRIARAMLSPFQGMRLVRELDTLLGHTQGKPEHLPFTLADKQPPAEPAVTEAVEQALQMRRRLRFAYHAPTSIQAAQRVVDPIAMRAVEGHLYLIAFDTEKQAARTFKLLRMGSVEVLQDAATPHPEVDEEAMFADSVKAWSGDLRQVVIKIPARLAGVANEWPLVAAQQVDDQGDGTALVRAKVSGLVEAMRWALRWGSDAEVVTPEELRRMVSTELSAALKQYA